MPIDNSEIITLTHGLGGSVDNYVVDLQFKAQFGCGGINCKGYGGTRAADESALGGYYKNLGAQTIEIGRHSSDCYVGEFRVRIWVYN